MARALIINPETQAQIDAAVERARGCVNTWEAMQPHAFGDFRPTLTLAERKEKGFPRQFESQRVEIQVGYTAAFSFEEQPAGLCRHLSVSVDVKGRVPNQPAMEMIAVAFGFLIPLGTMGRVWVEEFAPGHNAINVVQVCDDAHRT